MVEAHLKQFSDSRNSFTCSCILLASFFFLVDFLRIPIEAVREKILQTQIFSTGADGDIVYQSRSSWYVVVT